MKYEIDLNNEDYQLQCAECGVYVATTYFELRGEYFGLCKSCFEQFRKMLKNAWKDLLEVHPTGRRD
jgi:hypothetical protein